MKKHPRIQKLPEKAFNFLLEKFARLQMTSNACEGFNFAEFFNTLETEIEILITRIDKFPGIPGIPGSPFLGIQKNSLKFQKLPGNYRPGIPR